ncbi:TonB-dependent receptor [Pedobacter frigiditerrae]|uniref:TonB-dependent receptor n=1 Tax=Pedobacter frigiditerrae TaxID=2530452 RepID=A0A4V2MI18_9SPHI|nr:TonB-dependent receptor [Pedobacter frigiditerrae]TCC88686.1 TonB-dependent receptor [Pedobacter frigiditerrae]
MKFKQQLFASAAHVLRITFVQILFAVCFVCAMHAKAVNAQDLLEKRINMDVKDETLLRVLNSIRKQTEIEFSFIPSTIKADRKITYSFKNKKLIDFLSDLAQYDIGYRVVDQQIVLFINKKITASTSMEPNLLGLTDLQRNNTAVADIEVSGYVLEAPNLPLPGVSVVVKGTKVIAITDAKGFFKLRVSDENAILVFTSVGFTTQEVRVGSNTTFKIELAASRSNLNDVVIVGYGTQKKPTVTGSVSSITTKELVQSPVANISNSLVGRMPGLFATQGGGEPGRDGSTIRIRGVGTFSNFSGAQDPLVLVDGIQVENYNNIDPNEIETLSILKDASATAVYGIRGANGVLLITTKRGKEGKATISYTFNAASNSFTGLRETMNSYDYAKSWNKGIELDRYNLQANTPLRWSDEELEKFRTGSDPVLYPNINWYDLMLKKTSGQSSHNINVSGGQKRLRYFISAGIFSQDGLFNDFSEINELDYNVNSTYKRYNFRSNFNFDITKRFKIALDLSSQSENRKLNNSNVGTDRLVADVGRAAPMGAPGIIDGKIVDLVGGGNNPLFSFLTASGAGGIKRSYRNNLNGSLKLDHMLDFITAGLGVHGMISTQTYNGQDITNSKSLQTYIARPVTTGGYVLEPASNTPTSFNFAQTNLNRRRLFAQFSIDYQRVFGSHNVSGLLLYDQQKNFDPAYAFGVSNAYQSVVARVTYNYKGKYLADFNGAYNGTENFAPGKQFGFFPAGSVGWVPTLESFFPKNDIVSFVKLRASYGVTGNDRIGDINDANSRFLYRESSYTPTGNTYYFGIPPGSIAGFPGIREGRAGNTEVTWERKKTANVAIEANFFADKLRLVAEVFDERRNSILLSPNNISAMVGFLQPALNIGRMNNRGYEGELTYSNKFRGLDYRIGGNFSFARNKVLFRDEIVPAYPYLLRTGQRLGQGYYLLSDGLFNTWDEVNDPSRPVYDGAPRIQPGDVKFRDINSDGFINSDDQIPLGYSNLPEKTYGISLYGRYKSFDISVLFQGVSNVSYYYTRFQKGQGWQATVPEGTPSYLIESWTPERYAQGLPIKFPRLSRGAPSQNANGSQWLADASYLRVKNVELGYVFNASLLKKAGISSLRLYCTGNNLFTWSKMLPGIDPENVSTGDVNTEPYPLTRTLNLGLNVNF